MGVTTAMSSPPKTKLQEEMDAAVYAATHFKDTVSEGFKANPPPSWLMKFLDDLVMSKATVWFCAGLSIEAAGITAQMLMRIDSYPIMDALVGGLIAVSLYLYQRKRNSGVRADA